MNITSILSKLGLGILLGATLFLAQQAHGDNTSMGNGAWLADSAIYPNGHTGWTGCFSSTPPPTGCFIQFLGYDTTGKTISAVTLNGGVMVGGPPVQGDLDVAVLVDGQPVIVAFSGRWQGGQPGLVTSPPGIMSLGNSASYWSSLWLQKANTCPAGVPGNPCGCVQVSGGWVPIYACGK